MNRKACLPGLVVLVLASCASGSESWPRWARELAAGLECGMAIEDVKGLVDEEVLKLEAGPHPWLGQYYIRKRYADLWFRFNAQERLEWVTLSKMDGWRIMATRISPRRNLCTGELTYQVWLERTFELEGAAVYLDGKEVYPEGGKVTVSAGQHELRIEKTGYEPIIRHLDLGPEDRGDQRLDLTGIELRSVEP